MTTVNELANELLLLVFEELTLQALIASRGVSRKWRSLVPKAHIHPARRKLLDLYTKAIASPAFLATRADLISYIIPFDRATYIAAVEDSIEHCSLSDEFRLWILEWPACAVIGWFWPGLPSPCGHLINSLIKPDNRSYYLFSGRPSKCDFTKAMVRRCQDSKKLELIYYNENMYKRQGWQGIVWLRDLYYELVQTPGYKLAIGGEGLGEVLKGKVLCFPKDLEGVDTRGQSWVEFLDKELQDQDECLQA